MGIFCVIIFLIFTYICSWSENGYYHTDSAVVRQAISPVPAKIVCCGI